MKHKTGYAILAWFLLLGAGLWLIHAFLHWRFFYGGKFWDVLLFSVPAHDMVVRLILVLVALAMGWAFAIIQSRYRRMVDDLQRSEKMFRGVFDNSPSGMALVDTKTQRFLRVNSRMEAILGYSSDELTRMTVMDVTHPEDWKEEASHIREHLEKVSGRYEFQKRYIRKDGRERWVQVTGEIIGPIQPGGPRTALVLVADVTENLKVLERLKLSERRFRSMAETVPLGIQEIDRQGRIEWVNPAYCRMFQCTPEEAVGTFIWDHLPDPEPLRQLYALLMKDAPIPMEWIGQNVVGESTVIDVRVYWDYRRDEDYRVTGAVAVIADVTAEKRTDFHLRQARRMEAVGRLAGGVAHDLNNLLTPILGYSGLMRDHCDEKVKHQEAVEAIYQAGIRARDLVRRLLAFGRRQAMEFTVHDLNDVVRGMENLLRRIIRENVAIRFPLSDKPLTINADCVQLEQVLTNLAINAQDAMPEGGELTIETRRMILDECYISSHQVVKAGPYALMAVTDTGCGMDEETRERVFDPFFTTKTNGAGTGLGLATIYGVVKQHGGYIWVYSEPGRGSTFKLYFPLKEDVSPAMTVEKKRSTHKQFSGNEQVLVVEDDPMVRRLAAGMLRQLGYRVTSSGSGKDCLDKCEKIDCSPDLLLTDVVMPGMTGRELFNALKQRFPDLKVVYMSGYTDNVIVHQGILDTGTVLLQKPFSIYDLAERIRTALDKKATPGNQ